jgi:hypothetical protein
MSVAVAQLWNLFRDVKRLDVDGISFISSPYKLRHGQNSVAVDLPNIPMPGQLVTYVPALVHQEAADRTGPRGVDAIFV